VVEILGITLTYETIFWLTVFAIDELLPLLPIKANSFTQLFASTVRALKPMRKEDEIIAGLVAEVQKVREEIKALKEGSNEDTKALDDLLNEVRGR
jgi:hypothetical protein